MGTTDRAPAFPFYAKDWLADPKVLSMSFDHKGRYIHLLASMWEYSTAGCHMPYAVAVKLVGRKFVDVALTDNLITDYEDREGRRWVFSDRMSEEAQKLKSRSEAAKRSVAIKWERFYAKQDAESSTNVDDS